MGEHDNGNGSQVGELTLQDGSTVTFSTSSIDPLREAEFAGGKAVGDPSFLAVTLAGRTWALRPEVMEALAAALSSGGTLAYLDDDMEPEEDKRSGSVAIVPLKGIITPGPMGLLSLLMGGGGGLKAFKAQLAEAAADEEVGHIVLDVDSPGGLVDLVPETAAFVRDVAERKPVTAVANTMAASAAYWIASQANEVVVTPSGQIGSVGVYITHTEISKALEKFGETVTLISAGKYKTEGNLYEPLGSEAQKALQGDVDLVYGQFVRDVAKGRDTSETQVREGYGQGRVERAPNAVASGLADRVASLEDVVLEAVDAFSADEAAEPVTAKKIGTENADRAETDLLIELGSI